MYLFYLSYLFFTKWGATSLDRVHMDGSNQTSIVTTKIIYPFGIALDLANEHVYWVDTYMDSVERVDYNGKNRWSVRKTSTSHVYMKLLHSVAIFENTIYVASWNNGQFNQSIVSIDKHQMVVKRIVSRIIRPDSLHVLHRQRQPEVAHPCRVRNGGCDQLCIPAWKNSIAVSQCVCSPGYRLKTKTSCVLIKHASFLMYTKRNPPMIKGTSMSPNQRQSAGGHQEPFVPILNVRLPLSLDYNVKEQLIYFAQSDA